MTREERRAAVVQSSSGAVPAASASTQPRREREPALPRARAAKQSSPDETSDFQNWEKHQLKEEKKESGGFL